MKRDRYSQIGGPVTNRRTGQVIQTWNVAVEEKLDLPAMAAEIERSPVNDRQVQPGPHILVPFARPVPCYAN